MRVPDLITLTVSVLALLVSAASAIATWRTNRRQSQHQERLVNLETAREQDRQHLARSAKVRASIDRGEQHFRERMIARSPQYWLVIRNDGMALARNVCILLDGKPILEHPLVPDGEEEIHDHRAWYRTPVHLGGIHAVSEDCGRADPVGRRLR